MSSKIASGSYATVYRYMEESSEEMVIKHYEVTPKNGLSSAYREIEMLSQLRHPNIVSMKGIVADKYRPQGCEKYRVRRDGGLHILMERASYTLNDIKLSALSMETIKETTIDILLGLEYLHKNHIIHRDLSASNILLMRDGRACICDLGMSKYFSSEIEVNDLYVHPFVRAPEMYSVSSYDYRIDVWSLGTLVAMMLTGSNPFEYLSSDITESDSTLSSLTTSVKSTYRAIAMILANIPLCPSEVVAMRWIQKCLGNTVNITPLLGIIRAREGGRVSALSRIQQSNPDAYSFLECTLAFQRKDRYRVDQLLSHKWLSEYSDKITTSRNQHLRVTIANPREWREVQLPSSAVRLQIRDYILDYGDYFAPDGQVDRCTSRICLSLNLFYRVISSIEHPEVNKDAKEVLLEDIQDGRLFLLYLVCVVITLKYCGTNTVPDVAQHIPEELRDILMGDYLSDREYLVLSLLQNHFYQHTTYDILVGYGMRVSRDSAQSVWMMYLGGRTGRRCIEKEYDSYMKQLVTKLTHTQ